MVGVQDPKGGDAYLHTLYLSKGSIVTSGDYQRAYMVDGQLYHHIIDPHTLYPGTLWRAVTVVCEDSGLADALSTGLFLMDLEAGKALAQSCGAEVQKGNAPEERKIQRLFRDPKVTQLIKRCNDFGAGGVSVAIGELADGLEIDLNKVPKKSDGLDGTELAISESQERMAVVVEAKDVARFLELAGLENLEATPVAVVKAEPRLVMHWNGKKIVDISREFLNSNGAEKHIDIAPVKPECYKKAVEGSFKDNMEALADVLHVCS